MEWQLNKPLPTLKVGFWRESPERGLVKNMNIDFILHAIKDKNEALMLAENIVNKIKEAYISEEMKDLATLIELAIGVPNLSDNPSYKRIISKYSDNQINSYSNIIDDNKVTYDKAIANIGGK